MSGTESKQRKRAAGKELAGAAKGAKVDKPVGEPDSGPKNKVDKKTVKVDNKPKKVDKKNKKVDQRSKKVVKKTTKMVKKTTKVVKKSKKEVKKTGLGSFLNIEGLPRELHFELLKFVGARDRLAVRDSSEALAAQEARGPPLVLNLNDLRLPRAKALRALKAFKGRLACFELEPVDRLTDFKQNNARAWPWLLKALEGHPELEALNVSPTPAFTQALNLHSFRQLKELRLRSLGCGRPTHVASPWVAMAVGGLTGLQYLELEEMSPEIWDALPARLTYLALLACHEIRGKWFGTAVKEGLSHLETAPFMRGVKTLADIAPNLVALSISTPHRIDHNASLPCDGNLGDLKQLESLGLGVTESHCCDPPGKLCPQWLLGAVERVPSAVAGRLERLSLCGELLPAQLTRATRPFPGLRELAVVVAEGQAFRNVKVKVGGQTTQGRLSNALEALGLADRLDQLERLTLDAESARGASSLYVNLVELPPMKSLRTLELLLPHHRLPASDDWGADLLEHFLRSPGRVPHTPLTLRLLLPDQHPQAFDPAHFSFRRRSKGQQSPVPDPAKPRSFLLHMKDVFGDRLTTEYRPKDQLLSFTVV